MFTVTPLPSVCLSPSHNPPTHMVFPAGMITWTCPSCGVKTTFVSNTLDWQHVLDVPKSTFTWTNEYVDLLPSFEELLKQLTKIK